MPFVKHSCTRFGCATPCVAIADGFGRSSRVRNLIVDLARRDSEGIKRSRSCHGRGDWILRTNEFPEAGDEDCSAPTRKGYRVLFADDEVGPGSTNWVGSWLASGSDRVEATHD